MSIETLNTFSNLCVLYFQTAFVWQTLTMYTDSYWHLKSSTAHFTHFATCAHIYSTKFCTFAFEGTKFRKIPIETYLKNVFCNFARFSHIFYQPIFYNGQAKLSPSYEKITTKSHKIQNITKISHKMQNITELQKGCLKCVQSTNFDFC